MPGPLASMIRAKYPGAYDDLDDAALESSVLAKHPEYQDLAGPTVSAEQAQADMRAKYGSGGGDTTDAERPGAPSALKDMLESAAHPQTAGDFLTLLQPNTLGAGAMGLVSDAGAAVGRGVRGAGRLVGRMIPSKETAMRVLDSPLMGVISPRAQNLGKLAGAVRESMSPAAVATEEAAPAAASVARHVDMARPIPAGMLTQEQIGERIAASRAQGYVPPPPVPKPPMQISGRMVPPEAPPAPPAATYDRPMWSRDPGGPGAGAMSVQETAENLRALYGSKEAAQRLGISVEAIERLAPGPSRIPVMQRVSSGYRGGESLDQGFARGVSDPRGIGTTEALGGIVAGGGIAEAVRRQVMERLRGRPTAPSGETAPR